MIVSPPPARDYDQANERQFRDAVARADRDAFKRGEDIELVHGRLILTAPDGGQFVLGVDNAGNLTASPL